MAKRVRVIEVLIDDFDGKELPEGEGQSFQFNWQGVDYELDTSLEHAEQLQSMMQPVINAARRTGGRKLPSRKTARAVSGAKQDGHQEPRERPALPSGQQEAASDSEPEPAEGDTPERTRFDNAVHMSYRNRPRRKRHELDEIRNWLWEQGYSKEQVPEYGGGGIPDWAVFLFEQAHPEKATRDWTKMRGPRRRTAPEPANAK